MISNYQLNLSTLQLGSRVGIMRSSDGSLRYYSDGIDQGVACSNVPAGRFFQTAVLSLLSVLSTVFTLMCAVVSDSRYI